MDIGKVVGNVWATRKDEKLCGQKLLVVKLLKTKDTYKEGFIVAADNALKTELNTAIDEKAKKATDLAGYGITDAYTKNDADAKITAATADMATKTQVTADNRHLLMWHCYG